MFQVKGGKQGQCLTNLNFKQCVIRPVLGLNTTVGDTEIEIKP